MRKFVRLCVTNRFRSNLLRFFIHLFQLKKCFENPFNEALAFLQSQDFYFNLGSMDAGLHCVVCNQIGVHCSLFPDCAILQHEIILDVLDVVNQIVPNDENNKCK